MTADGTKSAIPWIYSSSEVIDFDHFFEPNRWIVNTGPCTKSIGSGVVGPWNSHLQKTASGFPKIPGNSRNPGYGATGGFWCDVTSNSTLLVRYPLILTWYYLGLGLYFV